MDPFSKIRFSLVRAMRASSNAHGFESSGPSKGKMRLGGVVAVVLGFAVC
jgi:hypothetical protein